MATSAAPASALDAALAKVRELELSRDAMLSSIASLKVLVSNERAQARVAKRKLAAAADKLALAPDPSLLATLDNTRAQLADRDKLLDELRAEKEQSEQESAAGLEENRNAREQEEQQTARLREEVAALQRHIASRDEAAREAAREAASSASNEREADLRFEMAEKDTAVRAAEMRLRDEVVQTAALKAAVAEVPALRARLRQLKSDGQVAAAVAAVHEDHVDVKRLDETGMKRKLFELKIARSVICEKDKIVKEMKGKVAAAEGRELEAVLACKMSEQHAKHAEEALNDAKKQMDELREKLESDSQSTVHRERKADITAESLVKANQQVSALSLKVGQYEDATRARAEEYQKLEEKTRLAEQNLANANKEISVLAAKIQQYEQEKKEQGAQHDLEDAQRQKSEAQRREAVTDMKNLKSALEASEKEVARLENILAKRANSQTDDLGASSPCSTDAGTEEQRALPTVTESESMEKLNELEEVAKLAKSSYEQKCLEAQALASSVSENATTIVTLNRALLVSRNSCDEKHAQLEGSMSKANALEKSVRKLKAELVSRIEECEFLEHRIRSELEPSLLKANTVLDQRLSELKVMRDEYELHKELSDKTRTALENEMGGLSERLQDALTALGGTQNMLTQSEERSAVLEDEIAALAEEKRKNRAVIEDLTGHCEHRREALIVLQQRLVDLEETVGDHEQAALDANNRTEELLKALAEAQDRQAAAEHRASRKDALVDGMEHRTRQLERNHGSMRAHLSEKTLQLEASEQEGMELKEIVDLRDEALINQAQICCNREALFDSLVTELRGVIISRDLDIKTLQEELQTVERRAKSLTEELAQINSTLAKTEHDLVMSKRQYSDSVAESKRQLAKLSESQDEMSRMRAEYQAAQEELTIRDRRISSQLLSITQKGGKIAGLRAEKAELEKLVGEIRSELSAEQALSEAHCAEVKRLEGAFARVSSDLANNEEEMSLKNAETETLSNRLASAQTDVVRLENLLSEKDEEIESTTKATRNSEIALERSKQQLRVLESHLNGHDTLLKDCREKEEALVVKCGELDQAREYILEMERSVGTLQEQLSIRLEEVESWTGRAVSFENAKEAIEKELATAQEARAAADNTLNVTAASLAALEKASAEEIADLRATMASLQKVLDEKECSLSSASEVISQNSMQGQLTKEQLIDSRTRGDRLFERLTSAEYELASKKESLVALETRFREVHDKLESRERDVERLERNLVDRSQALTHAHSRVDELTVKTSSIAKGELLTMQTKLDAKEKAIANLHNWCCFINGKLHVTEKTLSEREVDLEVSTTAFKKLELQLQRLNGTIAEKESHVREIESSRVVETSELRSRIQTLQSHIREANAEVEKTKGMMSSDGDDTQAYLVELSNELREYKDTMQAREMEMCQMQARSQSLQETVNSYERELSASGRTIEALTLDLGRIRSEVNNKRDVQDVTDKNAALEVSKVRSETGYLLVELRRAEAELAAANENAETWQARCEELQPLAESTMEAQRSIEMISSRLMLAEKDSRQRIDLLETQLEEARRERDAAERDCGAALADYAAVRARLADGGSHYSSVATSVAMCIVTFTLDGMEAPSSDVTVYLLGGDATLGNWDPTRRIAMRVVGKGRSGVIRKCEVVVPANTSTSYKFVADGADGSLVWEAGENRGLDLQGSMQHKSHDTWRSTM